MKYSVVFYGTFSKSPKELTLAEHGAVMTTMMELTESPDSPGLNVHRIGEADTKCWSARVNDDIRLVFFRTESTVVPAYVAHHDAAYRWAEGRALDVHPDTGAAQIVIVGERREEIIKRIVVPKLDNPLAKRPFEHLTDEVMLSYGTPKPWLPAIREATVDAFLEEIGDALPDEAREFLMAVALGEVPPPPPLPKRSRNPFTHPDAKRRFYLVESDEDLQRALKLDWEQWMLYLHPSQREAVDREFAGPARVTGGPGTGKSVVAVHRAARLAREGSGRVLLTSFSKTLGNHLRQQLDQLMADDPARECVEVVHLHHLAVELLNEARGEGIKVADGQAIGKAAKAAAEALGAKNVTPSLRRDRVEHGGRSLNSAAGELRQSDTTANFDIRHHAAAPPWRAQGPHNLGLIEYAKCGKAKRRGQPLTSSLGSLRLPLPHSNLITSGRLETPIGGVECLLNY